MADALDHLRTTSVPLRRVLLIGGAARSPLVGEIAAQIFGVPVTVPEPNEYVALGAARQAAWALRRQSAPNGTPPIPNWLARPAIEIPAPSDRDASGQRVRAEYQRAQKAVTASDHR
jgi:xylulokinase